MLVRIANREDTNQLKKHSDLGLHCLSMLFWQAKFRISTVPKSHELVHIIVFLA